MSLPQSPHGEINWNEADLSGNRRERDQKCGSKSCKQSPNQSQMALKPCVPLESAEEGIQTIRKQRRKGKSTRESGDYQQIKEISTLLSNSPKRKGRLRPLIDQFFR